MMDHMISHDGSHDLMMAHMMSHDQELYIFFPYTGTGGTAVFSGLPLKRRRPYEITVVATSLDDSRPLTGEFRSGNVDMFVTS